MMKPCVVLNGKVINVGDWDYQYTEVDGEQVAQNPLPEGAVIEEREFEYDEDRGWYEVGTTLPKTQEDYLIDLDFRLSLIELGLI